MLDLYRLQLGAVGGPWLPQFVNASLSANVVFYLERNAFGTVF